MYKYTQNATVLALATAAISGVSVFINKYAVSAAHDPILFTGLKNSIVAIFLIGIVFAFSKHREIRNLTKREWLQLATIGLVGGAVPFALFYMGLSMIPAATGALIHKTLFVWVALFGITYLNEGFSKLQWLGVAALFVSNLFLGGFVGFAYNTGEFLVFGATILWAIENILAKRALAKLSSITVASGRMVFGALFLALFLMATGRVSGLADMSIVGFEWTLLTSVLLLGYVLTWYTALKYAPASYVAALLVPATLVTNVLSAVFVTGTLTSAQAISGFLAVAGTALVVAYTTRTATQLSDAAQLEEPSTVG
jgi:drug/metabolite transporter (DMT)-like permease